MMGFYAARDLAGPETLLTSLPRVQRGSRNAKRLKPERFILAKRPNFRHASDTP